MGRAWIALMVASLVSMHGVASAQDMTFSEEDTAAAEQPAEGTEGAAEGAEGQPASGGDDLIGSLAGGNDTQAQAADTREAAPRRAEAIEEIYALQRIYALRNGRVELSPSFSTTVNDPYVTHPSIGLGLNYWWTNVLAVGLNFMLYQGLENESDLNFHVRRSTRLAVPISEYQLGAHLNFTYVPLYGKFAMFNEYIFQWDAYIVGGVGIMRTRPVPVIDPAIREFEFNWRVAFNVGIGLRVFVTRFLAIFGELRDYAYLEQLENLDVAIGPERTNEDTWLADGASLTNNVALTLGFTLFFPFSFEYRLPK